LTRVESELMALFWKHGAMTVAHLHELVPDKAYTSLATLVKILEQKGYLTHTAVEGERAFLFAPAVESTKARKHHLRDLINRLFGGKSETLLVGLLDDEELTRDELKALRAEIDERLAPKKGKR
jgi:predicted transcriptional regulator